MLQNGRPGHRSLGRLLLRSVRVTVIASMLVVLIQGPRIARAVSLRDRSAMCACPHGEQESRRTVHRCCCAHADAGARFLPANDLCPCATVPYAAPSLLYAMIVEAAFETTVEPRDVPILVGRVEHARLERPPRG